MPGKAAAKLAYYSTANGTRVVAPRRWRCVGRYGSNGSTLMVAPTPSAWAPFEGKSRCTGLAVVRSLSFGGTSGRSEVAAFAARLVSAAARYVAGVEGERIGDPFSRDVPRADRIARRGDYEVLFTTPARAIRTGARAYLAPGPLPIGGIATLAADEDLDPQTMDARLPTAIRPPVAYIIRQVEREVGAADRTPGR